MAGRAGHSFVPHHPTEHAGARHEATLAYGVAVLHEHLDHRPGRETAELRGEPIHSISFAWRAPLALIRSRILWRR